jgi:hypothetical protein
MDLFHRLLQAGGDARYEPAALVLHERTTREGRLSRRSAYGYGMGAAVGLWLREDGSSGWRVLGAWARLRGSILVRAAARGRWLSVYEEALVLGGTMKGLVRGLTTRGGTRSR